MDFHNSIIEFHNTLWISINNLQISIIELWSSIIRFMEIQNRFMELHVILLVKVDNSIMQIHNSIMYLHNSTIDFHNLLYRAPYDLWSSTIRIMKLYYGALWLTYTCMEPIINHGAPCLWGFVSSYMLTQTLKGQKRINFKCGNRWNPLTKD